MSDKEISQMDFKELRKEVQSLRDELAIMQRKYEDILYNLDYDNFGSELKKDLTSIISSDDVESMISQTADEINTRISSVSGSVSSVKQTVNGLTSRVSDAEGVTSKFEQTAYGFTLDGEKVTFTGVIYLTDDNGKKRFSLFYSDVNTPQVIFHGVTSPKIPLVLGDKEGDVYIASPSTGNEVATQSFVEDCLVDLI